jgi:predicted permease
LLLVALTVIVATAFGIACQQRSASATRAARGALQLMLYALVPFVAFVNINHLHLTLGGGVGLAVAYVGIATAGLATWAFGHYRLRLPRAVLGAVIVTVLLHNTGYLGLPTTVAILGSSHLVSAVAYDQLVGGPTLYIGGFAVGAAFGTLAAARARTRLVAFFTRNPPMLAAVAGLVAPNALAPPALVHASHYVVDALLPLGFFAVGVFLAAEEGDGAARLFQWPGRAATLAVVMRLAWAPVLLIAFSLAILRVPSAYVLEASMPTGITSLVVGQAYGLDQHLMARIIVWSTSVVLIVALIVATGVFGHA